MLNLYKNCKRHVGIILIEVTIAIAYFFAVNNLKDFNYILFNTGFITTLFSLPVVYLKYNQFMEDRRSKEISEFYNETIDKIIAISQPMFNRDSSTMMINYFILKYHIKNGLEILKYESKKDRDLFISIVLNALLNQLCHIIGFSDEYFNQPWDNLRKELIQKLEEFETLIDKYMVEILNDQYIKNLSNLKNGELEMKIKEIIEIKFPSLKWKSIIENTGGLVFYNQENSIYFYKPQLQFKKIKNMDIQNIYLIKPTIQFYKNGPDIKMITGFLKNQYIKYNISVIPEQYVSLIVGDDASTAIRADWVDFDDINVKFQYVNELDEDYSIIKKRYHEDEVCIIKISKNYNDQVMYSGKLSGWFVLSDYLWKKFEHEGNKIIRFMIKGNQNDLAIIDFTYSEFKKLLAIKDENGKYAHSKQGYHFYFDVIFDNKYNVKIVQDRRFIDQKVIFRIENHIEK